MYNAMMVDLTINGWSGRKQSKDAMQAVDLLYNATNAGNFSKALVDRDELAKINKAASKVRAYHHKMTMPWNDGGTRVLPSVLYFEYMNGINNLKEKYLEVVEEFLNKYDDLVEKAKDLLGGLFNQADYPSGSRLRCLYDVRVLISPLAASDDFRVSLDASTIESLKEDYERESKQMLTDAIKDVWKRMHTVLTKLHERMTGDTYFKNTIITNVEELCDVARAFNLTRDPKLDKLIDDVLAYVVKDPKDLRKSAVLREETASFAKSALDQIDKVIGVES